MLLDMPRAYMFLAMHGHGPGLSLGATVTAEPGRGARMPAAAGRANWGA